MLYHGKSFWFVTGVWRKKTSTTNRSMEKCDRQGKCQMLKVNSYLLVWEIQANSFSETLYLPVVCPKPFPFLFTEDPQVPAFNYLFPPVLLGEVPEKITRRDLGEQEVFAHTALTNRNKSWKSLTASF